MSRAYRALKAAAPYVLVVLDLWGMQFYMKGVPASSHTDSAFFGCADYFSTDPYIVSQVGLSAGNTSLELPLSTFGDVADAARAWAHHSKVLHMVPQAFGGVELWVRQPSAAEIRAMSYLALIHGAAGVSFFTDIGTDPQVYPTSPATWAAARSVASEFRAFTAEVAGGTPLSAPGGSGSVQWAAWERDSTLLVLLVNVANAPASANFSVPSAYHSSGGTLLFGTGRCLAAGGLGSFIEPLEPYGVRAILFHAASGQRDESSSPCQGAPPAPGSPPNNWLLNPSFEVESSLGFPDGYGLLPPAAGSHGYGASAQPTTAVARSGRASLRLVTARPNASLIVLPFPEWPGFPAGGSGAYEFSLFARAAASIRASGRPLSLVLAAPSLPGGNATACVLAQTASWTRCRLLVSGAHGGPTSEQQAKFQVSLASPGEAFVDDVALVRA
mgnify:CR=1 FL=1